MKPINTDNGPILCVSCAKCGIECESKPESVVNDCLDYEKKLTPAPQYICLTCANKDFCNKEGKIPNDGYDCTEWKPKLQETPVKKDEVNHPDHYTQGGIECIDCIRASMSKDGFEDYCKGNVIKYLHRWRFKGGVQDLKKASVYLNWLIESAENGKILYEVV